jgi:hypothetical protein
MRFLFLSWQKKDWEWLLWTALLVLSCVLVQSSIPVAAQGQAAGLCPDPDRKPLPGAGLGSQRCEEDRHGNLNPSDKPLDPGEEQALKAVMAGLKKGIKMVSTLNEKSDTQEKIEAMRTKLENTQKAWDQIQAAKCIPGPVLESLCGVARDKQSRQDSGASCNVLCKASADWIDALTGDRRLHDTVFKACVNEC